MEFNEQGLLKERRTRERHCAFAAYWFFLIAVLTMVNTIVPSLKQLHFLVGLGVTQFIDTIAVSVQDRTGGAIRVLVGVIDLLFVTLFAVLGLLARKRSASAMIMGMVLYGFDALLFLPTRSFIPIAFHCLGLLLMYYGLEAAKILGEKE